VRLLYKPHPMTGSVDPRAGRANDRIQAMIREANACRGSVSPEAATDLVRRTADLERMTSSTFRAAADDVERMLLQSAPEPGRAAAVAEASASWDAAFWASLPEDEHQIITGPRPALYSCFDQADLLISDVSSVISDYLASEKPYAVANTSGLSEALFREAFPTVRAAAILTPDAVQIPALLDTVRDPELDALAKARAELKTYLLGPAVPSSTERFNEGAKALCRRADEHQARMETRLVTAIPAPRDGGADDAVEPKDTELETQ
jgi:hypothetical protein